MRGRLIRLTDSHSAILAILGIDDAGHNVITRTAALMALVSALMSLGFGGAYTIRFSSLKAPQRGLVWALVRTLALLSYKTAMLIEHRFSGDKDDDRAINLEYMDILISTSRLACLVGSILLCNHRFFRLDVRGSTGTVLELGQKRRSGSGCTTAHQYCGSCSACIGVSLVFDWVRLRDSSRPILDEMGGSKCKRRG